VPYSVPEYA
jgi:hypothetical protein